MHGFPHFGGASDLHGRAEVLQRPSPVPLAPGVYARWFREVPVGVDTTGCAVVDGLTLLYVGISPKEPPTNGRPPSRSTLRQRLRTHYAGNAAGSTLRKTLGCLLSEALGIGLRRVGSGERLTLTNPGEQVLDAWMSDNAFVTWQVTPEPWTLERLILASGLPLPLNIRDNPCLAHTSFLQGIRSHAVRLALASDVVPEGGGPRRAR